MYDQATQREAADPEGALVLYRCAQALVHRPAIALRIGTVEERLAHAQAAVDAFESYLALAGRDAADAPEMRRHIEQLRERIASAAQGAPGVEAGAAPAGPAPEPKDDLKVAPSVHASPPLAGWVIGAAGLGLAAAGGVLLAVALHQSDEVAALPRGTVWGTGAAGTYDAALRNQTLGLAFVAVGAAGLVAGAIVLWIGGKPVEVRAMASPGATAISGRLSF